MTDPAVGQAAARTAVDDVVARGYEVGGGDYERARPGYPSEALDVLLGELELGPTSVALELAAGTGKLTRLLHHRLGALVAVEPVPAMRRHLALAVPSVPVVAGLAEAVPLAGGSVDGVVVATAFHWFRGDQAVAEIARVLRPGGGLGLLWNNPDRSAPWVAAVWSVVDEHRGGAPGNLDGTWRQAFGDDAPFFPLEQRTFAHQVEIGIDDLVARVASISFIAALDPAARSDVLARVRCIAETHPGIAGRDRFELPYWTSVYWCLRR